MNKLTGWRHFVRIRTILRWRRKAVKRRTGRKTPLPVKSAGCPLPLFINQARRKPCATVRLQDGFRNTVAAQVAKVLLATRSPATKTAYDRAIVCQFLLRVKADPKRRTFDVCFSLKSRPSATRRSGLLCAIRGLQGVSPR
jgi:hypothetical protein